MNAPRHQFHTSTSSSACDRVLAAVRWYFRQWGRGPSYGDIQAHSGVHRGRVGRYLDQLTVEGFLTHERGVERSILLVDRFANASDEELIAACRGRNLIVSFPPVIAIPLGTAFPVAGRTDCPLEVPEELNDIPFTLAGDQRGQGQDQEKHARAGRGSAPGTSRIRTDQGGQ